MENADDLGPWVLVGYPCDKGPPETEYCVIRSSDTFNRKTTPQTEMYAIPASQIRVAPYAGRHDHDAGNTPLAIVWPANVLALLVSSRLVHIDDAYWSDATTTPQNSGVVATRFFVRIDRTDEKGAAAHFTRATYSCGNGMQLERTLGARNEPWFPLCPMTDDHGEIVMADAGPSATAALLPEPPAQPPNSRAPRHPLQWGVLLASVSLIACGLLLRRRPSP